MQAEILRRRTHTLQKNIDSVVTRIPPGAWPAKNAIQSRLVLHLNRGAENRSRYFSPIDLSRMARNSLSLYQFGQALEFAS
jgi:hypothetical protein